MRFLLPALFAFCFTAAAEPKLPEVKFPPQAREITPDEVQKLLTAHEDTNILDVRTAEEVAELGKLPGAKHLDLFHEHFTAELLNLRFDPAKPCVVYCALGGRAKRAALVLAQQGFKDIVLPQGGFNAWKKAGKPIDGGKPQP